MRAIYFIGFRGAGKSTVGRRLAEELGWDFFDLDEEWERRHGTTILEFVDEQGLDRFRESEHRLLRETAQLAGPVCVATGGGIVEFEPSRAFLLAEDGPKIFLDVDGAELWERLKDQPERLKIGGLYNLEELEKKLAARALHYEKIATYRVENRDITQALTEIKQLLGL